MIRANQKMYFFGLGILIIGLVLGYVLGFTLNYQRGLERGRQEIREQYQEKIEEIFPVMLEPDEIFFVSGEIKEIKDKALVLEEIIYSSNPFEDSETRTWRVLVVEATKLIKNVNKTPEEFEQELLGSPEMPPNLFKEVAIDFSELQVGQMVSVSSNENIKNKTEFEAQEVILAESMVP